MDGYAARPRQPLLDTRATTPRNIALCCHPGASTKVLATRSKMSDSIRFRVRRHPNTGQVVRTYSIADRDFVHEYPEEWPGFTLFSWIAEPYLTQQQIVNVLCWYLLAFIPSSSAAQLSVVTAEQTTTALVMDYLDGRSLSNSINRLLPLKPDTLSGLEIVNIATDHVVLEIGYESSRSTASRLALAISPHFAAQAGHMISVFNDCERIRTMSSAVQYAILESHPNSLILHNSKLWNQEYGNVKVA